MLSNQSKKALFPSTSQGPYTKVRIQESLLNWEGNSTEMANSFWKISRPEKKELFHATRIPPEAPIEGRKHQKTLGRIFLSS